VLLLAFVIEGRAYRIVSTMDASTRLLVILTFILLAQARALLFMTSPGGTRAPETSASLPVRSLAVSRESRSSGCSGSQAKTIGVAFVLATFARTLETTSRPGEATSAKAVF
jgi:hypothetical protein